MRKKNYLEKKGALFQNIRIFLASPPNPQNSTAFPDINSWYVRTYMLGNCN